jgi:hypothetical protein
MLKDYAMSKQKILEIIITALLSAGIAFLQSLLVQHTATVIPIPDPATAGGIGAILSTFRNIKSV